jgi:hypothetical protein
MRKKVFLMAVLTMVLVFAMALTAQACESPDCTKNDSVEYIPQFISTYFSRGYNVQVLFTKVPQVFFIDADGNAICVYDETLTETQVYFTRFLAGILKAAEAADVAAGIVRHTEGIQPRSPIICCHMVVRQRSFWEWSQDLICHVTRIGPCFCCGEFIMAMTLPEFCTHVIAGDEIVYVIHCTGQIVAGPFVNVLRDFHTVCGR